MKKKKIHTTNTFLHKQVQVQNRKILDEYCLEPENTNIFNYVCNLKNIN